MENLVLPQQFSKRIFIASFLMSTSVALAIHCQQYDCAYLATTLMSTSLVYWYYPVHGSIAQFVDRSVVRLAFAYQILFKAPYSDYGGQYLVLLVIGCVFYYLAVITTCKDRSSRLHCCMHLFANLANIPLYVGLRNLVPIQHN